MKILFVTHDVSNYGASKSLQALIKLMPSQVECGLVVQQPILRKIDLDEIRKQFAVTNIYTTWLPFLDCFVGRKTDLTLKEKIWILISTLLGTYSRFYLPRLAKAEGYQLIHLNSIVLLPLISKRFSFSLHIRELWDGRYRRLVEDRFRICAGLVYIDNVVQRPFSKFSVRRTITVENPVYYSEVAKPVLDNDKIWLRDKLLGKFVLAIIGRVTIEKGILFLLDVMEKIDSKSVVLIIVGEGELLEHCSRISKNDDRIICYGSESNIDVIYEIADVIIRAEDQPRIGRTVYEALYSGISVLIPGDPQDYPSELLTKYSARMKFYKTRDIADFISKIQSLVKQPPIRVERTHTDVDSIIKLVNFFQESSSD